MATIIDFLGKVLLDDDGTGSAGSVPISEYVHRAQYARAKCAWMSVAYRAVVNYVIAGMQLSDIRIRGSGSDRHPKDHEEWLWNVRPNPNVNKTDFIAQMLNEMFFGWHSGTALVVPVRDALWIADGWTENRQPGRISTYEHISIGGSTEVVSHPLRADELFVFRLPETSNWRILFGQMEAAYDEMAKSSIDAFGDKNDRRYLLKVDQQQAGTGVTQEKVNEYLKTSVSPFIQGTDVALPLFRGFDLNRMESDYSGGETTLDVVQIRQECFKIVATCLGIPYSFLEGNVNNFESVFDSVLTFLIDPIARVIQDELTAKLFTSIQWGHGSYVKVDTTHIRHVDIFAVADKVEKLIGSSIDTPNELRVLTGQEPVEAPGMDDYHMTLNHTDLSDREQRGGGDNNDDSDDTDAADSGGQG